MEETNYKQLIIEIIEKEECDKVLSIIYDFVKSLCDR